MNILFYNTSQVSELKGGTERITARICYGFHALGHQCFLAYHDEIPVSFPRCEAFSDEININQDSLEAFILKNHIDVIIVQKMTRLVKLMLGIRVKYALNFKIISVLHFNPGYEIHKIIFREFLSSFKRTKGFKEIIKNIIRIGLFPAYKLLYPLRNKDLYQKVYQYSDKVVVLSKAFIQEYMEYAGLRIDDKFVVIPNALSFDTFADSSIIQNKKRQVLIVSRLAEVQKRISIAIELWAMIEQDWSLNEWSLKIVGDGESRSEYENMVKELNLERVEFCGRKEPLPFYQASPIFMMTSAFEGWGLTLTEAQQFGCIPIAFDTYSSIHDIILDGANGFVVSEGDRIKYLSCLKKLMRNNSLRESMAQQAVHLSHRFELNSIIENWISLTNQTSKI